MAKISFTKLNLKTNTEVKTLKWGEQEVEVRQYLPIDEKIELVTNVLQLAHDPQNNFANPMKLDVYFTIAAIEKYTNLNITDKQKENPQKLYDALESSGFYSAFMNSFDASDLLNTRQYLYTVVEAFYNYRTSALGILDTVSTDYKNLDLNTTEMQKKIADPNNMSFLKDVLTKMG